MNWNANLILNDKASIIEKRMKKKKDLEIEEGRVGLAASELEGAEEDSDAGADAVGEEEALAEVSDCVGDAGLVGVIAGRVAAAGVALPPLQLLDRLPEPVLRLPDPALDGTVGAIVRGGRRRRAAGGGGRFGHGRGGGDDRRWMQRRPFSTSAHRGKRKRDRRKRGKLLFIL